MERSSYNPHKFQSLDSAPPEVQTSTFNPLIFPKPGKRPPNTILSSFHRWFYTRGKNSCWTLLSPYGQPHPAPLLSLRPPSLQHRLHMQAFMQSNHVARRWSRSGQAGLKASGGRRSERAWTMRRSTTMLIRFHQWLAKRRCGGRRHSVLWPKMDNMIRKDLFWWSWHVGLAVSWHCMLTTTRRYPACCSGNLFRNLHFK